MEATEFMAARKALGMTQRQMAERLGIGTRHLRKIEAGESPVRKVYAEVVGHIQAGRALPGNEKENAK